MAHMVVCARYKQEMEGLDEPPFDSRFWAKNLRSGLQEGMVASGSNARRCCSTNTACSPGRGKHQEFLVEQMQEYFFGEGSALPKEYVPPAQH